MRRLTAAAVFALVSTVVSLASAQEEIRIGFLAPLTGALAKSGQDTVRGHELFWEQQGNKVAGRPVRIIVADTACNPDNALSHARRLVHNEKVHFLVGPLCGHEGPAVAQVSRETGVPVFVPVAGADEITQWKRVPTVIRTGATSSQTSQPFGEWLAREGTCKNITTIGNDYTFPHEAIGGALGSGKYSSEAWKS